MDAGSIFLILALIVLVGLYIGRPFLRPQAAPVRAREIDKSEHVRSALLAERDRLLTALQELDFDNSLGKIPEEDYPVMRADMLHDAAVVLRQLDELQGAGEASDAEDRIEQVIAARRADAAVPVVGGAVSAPAWKKPARAQDDLEDLIASRRRVRQEKSAGFCPKCGKPAQKSDRFCSRCGATL